MNNPTSICLSCGLCCDGTLLGVVQLASDEISEVRKIKEIEEVNGNGFFLQPCPDFCDGCTIYEQRPKQCAIFKCGLLKAVEKDELDFNLALEAISSVKEIKWKIEEKITKLDLQLHSRAFYYKTLELKKTFNNLNSEENLSEKWQELLLEIEQFDDLIATKFNL
jgi:hypothetical protein